MTRIAIIGGGAAGCFCAVRIRQLYPDSKVHVFESGSKLMTKLAMTGGGRCNISNTFEDYNDLSKVYPRGERLMKRLFYTFSPEMTVRWWQENGIPLSEEDGGRLFPVSRDAMQVVRKLSKLMKEYDVEVSLNTRIGSLMELEGFDRIVVATGGKTAEKLCAGLDIDIEKCIPSLFSFKIGNNELNVLSGITVKDARLRIPGTRFSSEGDILITDWGISGPAVLSLSSYAARYLCACEYRTLLNVNWSGLNAADVSGMMDALYRDNPAKLISSVHPETISSRLWKYLLAEAGIDDRLRCDRLGKSASNKLVSILTNDPVQMNGRARFKNEFVSCGGISLDGIDAHNLSSKKYPHIRFAGEVLDIDAITGGFNLQAAWTTADMVAEHIME